MKEQLKKMDLETKITTAAVVVGITVVTVVPTYLYARYLNQTLDQQAVALGAQTSAVIKHLATLAPPAVN